MKRTILLLMLGSTAIAGDLLVDNLTVYGKHTVTQETTVGSIPTNQAVYYTFNTNTTPVPDDSGNNMTGTVSGATWSSSGWLDGCYSYDGNDKITVPNTAGCSTQESICMWFKADQLSASTYGGYLFSHSTNAPNTARIYFYQNTINFVGTKAGSYGFNMSKAFTDTVSWHHVAGVFKANYAKFYLDGVEVGTDSSVSMALFGATAVIKLGTSYTEDSSHCFKGKIDQFQIYKRILTSNEVYNLYMYNGTNFPAAELEVNGDAKFYQGINYLGPKGDLSMGVYTNNP